MRYRFFKGLNLKNKMALAIASLFILIVIIASCLTHSYLECTFKECLAAQQFSLVSSLADSIDDKLRIAQNALKSVAATAPADVFVDPGIAQRFLDERAGPLSIFDNGIFFVNKDGRLMAESPYRPDRRGKDLSFREWVQKTVISRKPYISDPFLSTHTPGRPAIVMTVPVFDKKGQMAGMMTGSLDLLGENFLAALSRARIGRTGYTFIADMNNRSLVVHPDKNRIMKPAAASGSNRMVDQAFKGFEGNGETVTSYGVPMLISVKRMHMASWFLAANYPQSEAYAPLRKAEHYFTLAAAAGTVVFLLVTWLTMRRLMLPLAAMTRHMQHLPEKPHQEHQIEIDSADEIGVLAKAFNTMIESLDRQQDELRDQKQRIDDERVLLDTLINAVPDMIFFKDQNGVYRRCNEACASTAMGLPRDLVIGRSDNDLFPPETAARFLQQDRQTMESGRPNRHEESICLEPGREMLLETIKVPIHDAQGACEGIIGISRDITERKRDEADRQRLEEQLIQSQKMESIGRLAGGVAHDLNNLLTPIIGYSELLKRDLPDNEAGLAKAGNILKAAHKAKELVQQLLSFSRKRVLEMKIIDLNQILTGFQSILRHTIRENIDIRFRLVAEQYSIRADRNQIEQIIMNLAVNAQDAIGEHGVIIIETAPVLLDDEYARQHSEVSPGRYLVLSVSDDGCGMDHETRQHIFEPFFTTKGIGKGTGLGLATVYGIVRQHGGNVRVNSEPGQGATFMCYFPIAEEQPSSEQPAEHEQVLLVGGRRTILLVEDNDMVRGLVGDMLTQQGFEVLVSEDPQQALRMSEGCSLDLLITDVVMPHMTGPELHARLVESFPGLKVLYMSGYTSNVISHQGELDEGMSYLQKPFAIAEFSKRVEMLLA